MGISPSTDGRMWMENLTLPPRVGSSGSCNRAGGVVVWYVVVQCGVVWCGVVWHGMVWCGYGVV